LSQRLAYIASGYPNSLPPDWPGSTVIKELTGQAAGLFIWAKTLVEFVHLGEPQEQLLHIQNGVIGEGDMAVLYRQILETSFKSPSPKLATWFCTIAGAIIVAKAPLSRQDIIHLLAIEPLSMLDNILMGLHSVMDSGDVLRFSHQSFVDFLVDSESCPPMFLVIEASHNKDLLQASLHAMEIGLQFNICQLATSHICNNDVPNLHSLIKNKIPTHLVYSCHFWADHLQATIFDLKVFEAVKEFFHTKLLYWMEVLSLIKEMNTAMHALALTANWMVS
jgi:hypothetical protein